MHRTGSWLDSDGITVTPRGTIKTYEGKTLTLDEARGLVHHFALLWGAFNHYHSRRMSHITGELDMQVREAIESEIKRRGLTAYVVAKHLEEQGVCSHMTVYRFLNGTGTAARKTEKAGEPSGNIKVHVLQALLDYLELTVKRV